MSAPYTANDVRNILEAFVADGLIDVPSAEVVTRNQNVFHAGGGDGINFTVRELLFSESALTSHVFLDADDEWFERLAEEATEANEAR